MKCFESVEVSRRLRRCVLRRMQCVGQWAAPVDLIAVGTDQQCGVLTTDLSMRFWKSGSAVAQAAGQSGELMLMCMIAWC